MIRPANRAGALLAIAVALFAQTRPTDLAGWDKITWGMTITAARSLYAIDAKPQTVDNWTLLTLKPVRIAGVEMDAQAVAPQAGEKISSVRLWSYFGLPTSAPGAGPRDFDALRGKLIEQYGAPASDETTHGLNFRLLKTVRWTFPSTSVVLTLEQSGSIPYLGNITLEYTAAPK